MNFLPQTRSDETLPVKDEGGGALAYPDYPTLPLDRENSQDDLRSKIIHYLFLLLKHKYLVAAIVCVFLFAGVIVTLQMQKIYSATTTIKIDQHVPQVFKTQAAQTEQSSDDTLETQLELIRSRTVAERVATALQLAQSDFLKPPKPSLFRRLFGGGSSADPPLADARETQRDEITCPLSPAPSPPSPLSHKGRRGVRLSSSPSPLVGEGLG